jgi:hypothetical protein
MGVSKRRTRPLSIDGHCFRWQCDFSESMVKSSISWSEGRITSPDRLLIRPDDAPHKLLTVCWPPCSGPVVKPALVKACIQEAIRHGWPAQQSVLELVGDDIPAQG